MSYAGLDHWITEGPRMDDDYPIERGLYACDGCGEWMPKEWVVLDEHGRWFCPYCIRRKEDEDRATDRGDWQCHQERDQ